MSELLVLGNGFDVACGLKSTYTDFYNDRYFESDTETGKLIFNEINKILGKDIEEILDIQLLYEEDINVSFWDFIFCQERLFGKNWTDVEEVLANKINHLKDLHLVFDYDENIHKRNTVVISDIEISNFNPVTNINQIDADFRKLAKIFLIFVKIRYSSRKVTSLQSDIANVLLDELIVFEGNFQKYLLNEVENNTNYWQKFSLLYNKLTEINVGQYDKPIDYELYVLSFNYTTFGGKNLSFPLVTYNNVHGQLSMKDNIFGIDITRDKNRDHYVIRERFEDEFLKTYRTLSLPNRERFYNNQVKVIRFYGHSLAQADYVYFKVIFDSLDLFDGDIQLLFFYSNYKNASGVMVNEKVNQIKRVRNLLLKYEESLGLENLYKGYIFDKLRTQGRITFIDVTELTSTFEE
ncbi:AbiH family protein [Lactococcus petauri]|uniref:AbiH family protein n=1 Tax=Lactococcus petauri TaxID=1940789 RepID=UPI003851FBA3